MHEQQMAQLQEAMRKEEKQQAEAEAKFEHAKQLYAEALAREKAGGGRVDAETAARYEEAKRLFEEASAAGQERVDQERVRRREMEERLRELRLRLRDRSEDWREQSREVRDRARRALERAEQEAKRYQEVVVRMQSRVRLGVQLDGTQGEGFDAQGVRVVEVVEDSPAEAIGLQEGDIITHLDGQSLLSPIPDEADQDFDLDTSIPVQRLMALVQEIEPGEEVEIRYLREGQPLTDTFEAADVKSPTVTVLRRGEGPERIYRVWPDSAAQWHFSFPDSTLEWEYATPDSVFRWHFSDPERESLYLRVPKLLELKEMEGLKDLEELGELRMRIPELHLEDLETDLLRGYRFGTEEGPRVFSITRGAGRYGLELVRMNPGLGEYFSTEEGLLVLNVDEDSELGLRPGDVLLAIGDRIVEDQGDVRRILASYEEDETVTFRIMRSGREIRVEGQVR
jgi:hypothetical protein